MAAKGGDVPKGWTPRQHGKNSIRRAERPERQSSAERLRQNHDIRRNAEMLERKEPTCAPHPGQNFVKNKQRAASCASATQRLDKTRMRDPDPAFGLNRFNHHRRDAFVDYFE